MGRHRRSPSPSLPVALSRASDQGTLLPCGAKLGRMVCLRQAVAFDRLWFPLLLGVRRSGRAHTSFRPARARRWRASRRCRGSCCAFLRPFGTHEFQQPMSAPSLSRIQLLRCCAAGLDRLGALAGRPCVCLSEVLVRFSPLDSTGEACAFSHLKSSLTPWSSAA